MEDQIKVNQETVPSNILISFSSIQPLRSTAPWMKLSSIVGFFISGLLFLSVITKSIEYSNTQFEVAEYAYHYLGLRILFAFVILFPSLILYKSSKRIKEYFSSNNETVLLSFFSSQKFYWQLLGLFFIITLFLSMLTLISMLIFNM